MDTEWINKQLEELDRLFSSKFDQDNIKFGISLLPDQKVGAAMDISTTSLERVPQDKKVLLEKIKALEEENKELRRKLVLKTLEYR